MRPRLACRLPDASSWISTDRMRFRRGIPRKRKSRWRREGFGPMLDFFRYIVGSLVDIVRYISHAVIVVFHNVVLLAVIVAFLYGIFRLCRYGLQYLWR